MRRALVLALLSASTARADDAAPVADHGTMRTGEPTDGGSLIRRARGEGDDEPLIRLDPMFVTPLDRTLLATSQRDEAVFDLVRGSRMRLSAEHWKDATDDARGVTASLHIDRDLGFARLVIGGSVNQVMGHFGATTALGARIALVKEHRFSRWTTLWIALGLDYQKWLGQPSSNTGVSLILGGTFR